MSVPLVAHARPLPACPDRETAVEVMSEAEFRAFYERTSRPLWAYLLRITRDPDRAQDVHQEAYYRFYRAGARHESEAHRRNSLFRIATNLVRDAARAAKRHPEVALGEDEGSGVSVASSAPGPERRVAARSDLGAALAHLTAVQRQMLWLAYAEGVSHQEIAEILGLRAVSIRMLLFRARRKLAAILGGAGRPAASRSNPGSATPEPSREVAP